MSPRTVYTVRSVAAEDAARLAELCGQLGYPAMQAQVERRLEQIQRDERHAAFVAESQDGLVLGWVHVILRQLLVADLHAELGGLIVDEDHRGCGIGRLLMERAERWARERGCQALTLRSNVVRREAHVFYERIGYAVTKTQLAFRKTLRP
jgi:GNAT superfamily N-acetyltransferase